eukprot:CAMPEP_0174892668 /NCGR_PEP_ID=MMETSP0167-20121228/7582_1 /TAXON_ID=38298 /ORGANISM="Rhodella maculata, Strain CCMP736" /LENGTH=37 /DNA_ID= /DNA_START= /DNA_END= /DNA_ORIENTATION=
MELQAHDPEQPFLPTDWPEVGDFIEAQMKFESYPHVY